MTDPKHPKKDLALSRREVAVAGLAAGTAALTACKPSTGAAMTTSTPKNPNRLPVAFFPHGGGPWPFVDLGMPQAELDELAAYLRGVRTLPRQAPKAILIISAHWEEAVPTVMTSPRPPMLYDYYGFPEASYRITWPAPGDPKLAARVRELLTHAGIPSAEDAARGFDHGTFVPLKVMYPEAELPTVQLSLKAGLDPAEHLRIGRALAPLRDEGVFIVGSGETFHNLRAFRDPRAPAAANQFHDWLHAAVAAAPSTRAEQLSAWASAPNARYVHPREEHLLPLMVIAGAAGEDVGTIDYVGSLFGLRHSGYHFG